MTMGGVAARIIASSEVWDMTLPWLEVYWDIDVLARYKRAGYTYVSVTLQDWPPTMDGMRRCIKQFEQMAAPESTWLEFGSSIGDIERGRRDGKLIWGLNSQEACLIGEDISRIAELYTLGVRHLLLAYNVRNLIADGCAEVADAGLSNFGRRVVVEMNRVGMIVDCAHTGRRSSLEAIEISENPVIFSHSNAYAVCPHIRNLRDEQIVNCAASGGVIGVVGVGAFLGDPAAESGTVFRHIDYIAEMVGAEHVGLGTDYVKILPVKDFLPEWQAAGSITSARSWPDSTDAWTNPTGTQIPVEDCRCFSPEQLTELVELLLGHGYSEQAIRGILGENFKRVYRDAERKLRQRSSQEERP